MKGADANVDELYVIAGVYANGEDIPNSGGVTDLGKLRGNTSQYHTHFLLLHILVSPLNPFTNVGLY